MPDTADLPSFSCPHCGGYAARANSPYAVRCGPPCLHPCRKAREDLVHFESSGTVVKVVSGLISSIQSRESVRTANYRSSCITYRSMPLERF